MSPFIMSTFTLEEVAKHNTPEDCWIVIDSEVYDVTKFLKVHPGGRGPLLAFAGQNATNAFFELHKQNVLAKYAKLKIGTLSGSTPLRQQETGLIDQVTPFAEHSASRGWSSPFFGKSHLQLRVAVRKFFDEKIRPDAEAMEEAGTDPSREMFMQMGAAGVLAARIGVAAIPWIKKLKLALPGGVEPEQLDYFHEQIAHEELAFLGFPGLGDGLATGLVIGLPPVIHFARRELQERVVPECLRGDKIICLAISEPQAGSDVAGLVTRGVKSADGKHWIVNGQKKWITNGSFSDYFVTAVRTGKSGAGGISLMLIERGPGVKTQKIKTSYSPSAGTATVFFDDALVPVENVLGKENEGFKCIMANFNHERWLIAVIAQNYMRLAVADCYRWAMQRKVFGKRLIEQPVIRFKLAQMTAGVESCQAWLDSITYQMNVMSYGDQTKHLGGPIALLKFQVTRTSQMVSDNACQIFGGRGITRTGMGQFVERNARSFKFPAIYGGSEEILADLAIRQAVKAVDDATKKNPKLAYLAKL